MPGKANAAVKVMRDRTIVATTSRATFESFGLPAPSPNRHARAPQRIERAEGEVGMRTRVRWRGSAVKTRRAKRERNAV
jgi:hypothetical protein